jgi:hypothetical protein
VAPIGDTSTAVVIGEECHIIARELEGPRGQFRGEGMDIDAYENLILLCRNDHKIIDDSPIEYTVDRLQQIKADHERWVDTKLSNESIPQYRTCHRVTKGSQLLSILNGGEGWGFPNDDCESDEELQLIGHFLQSLEDYIELGDNLETLQRLELQHEWNQKIKQIEAAGFVIYGDRHSINMRMINGIRALEICLIPILRVSSLRNRMGLIPEQPLPSAIGIVE